MRFEGTHPAGYTARVFGDGDRWRYVIFFPGGKVMDTDQAVTEKQAKSMVRKIVKERLKAHPALSGHPLTDSRWKWRKT